MGRSRYQRKAWEDNERRILEALGEKPVGFKGLLERVPIGRGSLNLHVKELLRNGKIRRGLKDGRMAYELTKKALDPADSLLRELQILAGPGIEDELGRVHSLLPRQVADLVLEILSHAPRWIGNPEEMPMISSMKTITYVDESGRPVNYEPWPTRVWLTGMRGNIDPFNLTIVMAVYNMEKNWIREVVDNLTPECKAPGTPGHALMQLQENPSPLLCIPLLRERGLQRKFDALADWWRKISPSIPGTGNVEYLVETLWLQWIERYLEAAHRAEVKSNPSASPSPSPRVGASARS